MKTPQQTVEDAVSSPEGRARLASSIASSVTDPPPQVPEIPHVEDDEDLLIPLWTVLLVSGVGTLVWGLLLLGAR